MTENLRQQPSDEDAIAELKAVARKYQGADGILMKAVQSVGRLTEGAAATVIGLSPDTLQSALEKIFEQLLDLSTAANRLGGLRDAPNLVNRVGIALSGAVGGWFGIAGILPDLAASTTVIFNTIQKIARKHGFDPELEDVRRECLFVFASGGPGATDDSASSSFVSSRMLVNGSSVSGLISRAAAEFSARLMTKLGAQAVPVIGALSGATVNLAFISYYETMAEVHFRLLRLASDRPDLDVMAAFDRERGLLQQAGTGRNSLLSRQK